MDKGRNQHPAGTRPHGQGIQIKFRQNKGAAYTYETLNWQPTPANLTRAGKLRQDILRAIKYGNYTRADFFNDQKNKTDNQSSFFQYAQDWLDAPIHDWKPQTRYKFKGILNRVWIPHLHQNDIRHTKYTDITQALKKSLQTYQDKHQKPPSASLYNDWLTCLRGIFDLAVLNGTITRAKNPAAELRNKTRPKIEPDPFDQNETNAIINSIYQHDGPTWGAWFELGFWTGMRYPSEPAALTWADIDLRKNEIRINKIHSKHAKNGIQNTTKTGVSRTIRLNSQAQQAINKLKKITGFKAQALFIRDNGQPVTHGDQQRNMWRSALKRLGIRYRDPYNMRHTYASWGLTNGSNPAWLAKQLGHSQEEFFKTYARWIGKTQDDLQMDIIERAILKSGAKVGQENSAKSAKY
jgi:integrase